MTIRMSSDKVAVVDTAVHWIPINESTPRGKKIQLINRRYGSATQGVLDASNSSGWTHWQALPTFAEDDHDQSHR